MPSDSTLEKPLPNNLDAERSVLGAVILDNNALNAAIENLKPEDFFLDQHRRVFTQMIALGESQQAIDLITLTEELHRRGDLEAAGGAPYLASLADGMPRVSNVEHYARIVKEKAILRNLIHATDNIQQRAFKGEQSGTLLEDALQQFSALRSTNAAEWRRKFHTVEELPDGDIDFLIERVLPAGVTFIGALSGAGKTWWAL